MRTKVYQLVVMKIIKLDFDTNLKVIKKEKNENLLQI